MGPSTPRLPFLRLKAPNLAPGACDPARFFYVIPSDYRVRASSPGPVVSVRAIAEPVSKNARVSSRSQEYALPTLHLPANSHEQTRN